MPQWQKINNGKWKTLEGLIREKSVNFREPIKIYTGVADELMLPDRENNLEVVQLAYRSSVSVTVPKFIWKILKHNGGSIAFINLNNIVEGPVIKNLSKLNENMFTDLDNVCEEDICASAGVGRWDIANRKDILKGKIICCKVNRRLQLRFPNIPADALEEVDLKNSKLCNFTNLNCAKIPQ